jgi:uncharacterized protein (DUF1330 family)
MSIKNSSAWAELFARDNCEPLGNNGGRNSIASSSSRSFEKAVACHESAEYPEAAAHRRKDGASELEIVAVESVCDLSAP